MPKMFLLGGSEDGFVVVIVVAAAAVGIGLWLWGKARGASMLARWAAAKGVRLVSAESRSLLKGPYFWTASKNQIVYRISVQYPDGAVRHGWARCGGWFLGMLSAAVDVRWDPPDTTTTAPGGFPVVIPNASEASGVNQAGDIRIDPAAPTDVPLVLSLIRGLAEYEKLSNACVATEDDLRRTLFGDRPYAEVLVARLGDEPAGFALFFSNYSTFLGKPGIYLEDVFVIPELRGRGVGKALLARLAGIARDRNCGRVEWAVLDWNEPAIAFYRRLGADVLPDWRICRVTGDAIARLADRA